MPRRQPPKGYYRATEAEKLLGVSIAMVRVYVQKGDIAYFVPEGMKQGYYRKSDVDRLASKLNASFDLREDDKEKTKLMAVSEREIEEVTAIGKSLFVSSEDNNDFPVYSDWRKKIHSKNPESMYVLKHGTQIVGYASVLPFKQDTDKIEQLLRARLIKEVDITPDDIEVYEKGRFVTLYIGAIGIRQDINKKTRTLYATSLVIGLIRKIVELGARGITINKIVAIGATHSGIRLLQLLGFTEIPTLRHKQREFIMVIETSGAQVAMQYKQALSSKEADKDEQQGPTDIRKEHINGN